MFLKLLNLSRKKIKMLFTGWEVRIGRNCALGLSTTLGRTQDLGHSFSQYGPPSRPFSLEIDTSMIWNKN